MYRGVAAPMLLWLWSLVSGEYATLALRSWLWTLGRCCEWCGHRLLMVMIDGCWALHYWLLIESWYWYQSWCWKRQVPEALLATFDSGILYESLLPLLFLSIRMGSSAELALSSPRERRCWWDSYSCEVFLLLRNFKRCGRCEPWRLLSDSVATKLLELRLWLWIDERDFESWIYSIASWAEFTLYSIASTVVSVEEYLHLDSWLLYSIP